MVTAATNDIMGYKALLGRLANINEDVANGVKEAAIQAQPDITRLLNLTNAVSSPLKVLIDTSDQLATGTANKNEAATAQNAKNHLTQQITRPGGAATLFLNQQQNGDAPNAAGSTLVP